MEDRVPIHPPPPERKDKYLPFWLNIIPQPQNKRQKSIDVRGDRVVEMQASGDFFFKFKLPSFW